MFTRRALAAGLLAALFFAVLTPWVLRPWFLGDDLVPRDEGFFAAIENADLRLNAWILAWVARASLVDPASIFDGNIYFPSPNTIALSENMLAHVPVTAPVWAATESALAVLKAMALESFVLAGLAMFALVYHHTRNPAAALVAGAAFTFAPWRVHGFPHPQYLATAYIPLAFLAIDLWIERRRWWSVLGLAAAIALEMLACLYLGYFILFGVAAYGGARLLAARERRGHAAIGIAIGIAIGAIAAAPVALPYLRARREGIIPPFDISKFAGHAWAPWDYVSLAFVGLAGVAVLLLVALDLAERLAARFRDRPIPLSTREWAMWAVVATGVLLSTGPYLTVPVGGAVPTPYLLLYELVPGFSAIRGPRRFFILVLAGLAALAGYAFARWTARLSRPAKIGAGVAVALACAVAAAPRPSPVMSAELGKDAMPVYRWLAEQPVTGGVLEMPSSAVDTDFVGGPRNARYMLASTLHWHPLVNGYSGYETPLSSFLLPAMRRLPEPEALDFLVNGVDVRWLVLHRDQLAGSEVERWANVDVEGLEPAATFGDSEVFAVTRKPSRDWRGAVVDPKTLTRHETLTGLPTTPLAPSCRAASLGAVKAPPIIALTAFPVPIPVEFANRSPCAWPAVGVSPAGLVGLTYQWTDPSGRVLPKGPFTRLLTDVPAGASVADSVMVVPPPGEPGSWKLTVLLEQHGQKDPLASATVPIEVRPLRAQSAGAS